MSLYKTQSVISCSSTSSTILPCSPFTCTTLSKGPSLVVTMLRSDGRKCKTEYLTYIQNHGITIYALRTVFAPYAFASCHHHSASLPTPGHTRTNRPPYPPSLPPVSLPHSAIDPASARPLVRPSAARFYFNRNYSLSATSTVQTV